MQTCQLLYMMVKIVLFQVYIWCFKVINKQTVIKTFVVLDE